MYNQFHLGDMNGAAYYFICFSVSLAYFVVKNAFKTKKSEH